MKSKEEELRVPATVAVLATCAFAPLIMWLFLDGAIHESIGRITLIISILILINAWIKFAEKYNELYGSFDSSNTGYPTLTKSTKIDPYKNVNRESGIYYTKELQKARKNNDRYKAYECATKVVESAPYYSASYGQRASIILEYFYDDEVKINQALEDLKYAYELDNKDEDVISAIKSALVLFNEKPLGRNIKCLQRFYDTFPDIAIIGSQPIIDLDINYYSNGTTLKSLLQLTLDKCSGYIQDGNEVSFLYSRRAALKLQLYGIQQINSAVEDLLYAQKINPYNIFDSLVRIESFYYIIQNLNSNEHVSKLLDDDNQSLENIVKNDIDIVESLNYETVSEDARSLKNDLVNVDNYLQTLKPKKFEPEFKSVYLHNDTTDVGINKAPLKTPRGRELDI